MAVDHETEGRGGRVAARGGMILAAIILVWVAAVWMTLRLMGMNGRDG